MDRIRNFLSLTLASLMLLPALAPAAPFFEPFDSLDKLKQNWGISTWGGDNRTHSASNVTVENGILRLKLSGSQPGQKPVCAEIVTKKTDFHYGTYRGAIRMTHKPGAVVGFFIYLGSPLNEVDIEFLTNNPKTAYFTLHHITTNVDHTTRPVAFDPSAAFHQYRFDWHPDSVVYFIDNQRVAVLKKSVPDRPALFMINHWSGNIDGWGGKAPTEDVFMDVDWAYASPEFQDPTLPTGARRISLRGVEDGAARKALATDGALRFLRDGGAFSLTGQALLP